MKKYKKKKLQAGQVTERERERERCTCTKMKSNIYLTNLQEKGHTMITISVCVQPRY